MSGEGSESGPARPSRPPRQPKHILEFERVKGEATRLRREHKSLVAEIESLREVVSAYEGLSERRLAPTPFVRREHSSGLHEAVAVAPISDWHIEEIVDPTVVQGLNEFNLEIAERRIERWVNLVLDNIDHSRQTGLQVRDLLVPLLGDLITGHIHEELVETTALTPPEASVWLLEKLVQVFETLARESKCRIVVPCVPGNHGRTQRKPLSAANDVRHSFEWIVYTQLAKRFEDDPQFVFTLSAGKIFLQPIFDGLFRLLHGHLRGLNFRGGVGGISVPLNRWLARQEPANMTFLGHFHQNRFWLPSTRMGSQAWGINGSLIGYSPWALECGFPWEPPTQTFFLWSTRRGPCRPDAMILDPDQLQEPPVLPALPAPGTLRHVPRREVRRIQTPGTRWEEVVK